jgi:hypothetical protein
MLITLRAPMFDASKRARRFSSSLLNTPGYNISDKGLSAFTAYAHGLELPTGPAIDAARVEARRTSRPSVDLREQTLRKVGDQSVPLQL